VVCFEVVTFPLGLYVCILIVVLSLNGSFLLIKLSPKLDLHLQSKFSYRVANI
jgi:hypothetical protein